MKWFNIFFICALSLCSCEDFLETIPKTNQTADQYYTNEVEVKNAVNGLYAWLGVPFQAAGLGEAPLLMIEYPTGQGNSTTGQQSLMNPDFEKLIYWDRIYVDSWWSSSYFAIEACNVAIKSILRLPQTDILKSYLAEAYFFRAYYYYRLVRIFGEIPLKLLPTESPADAMLSKASVKDVYEQAIVASLIEAEKLNILNSPSSGRVSNEAVKALMAQVYLSMAGYPLNQKDKYLLAAQKAKDVITSETGSLGLFKSDENLSWFEKLRMMEFDNQGEYVLMANYGPNPAPRQGFAFLVLPVGAEAISGYIHYGALIPNKDFIASFEDGDERANEKGFFFTSYPSMDDPEKIVTFEPAIYKYFDPSVIGHPDGSGKSIPLIRFAEILLIYAEASTYVSGSVDELAEQSLNDIRLRAGLPEVQESVLADKDLFIDEVRKQRVFELCYEGVAFFDMVRTQKAWDFKSKSFVDLDGFKLPNGAIFDVDKHCTFPIPLREIQINPDLK